MVPVQFFLQDLFQIVMMDSHWHHLSRAVSCSGEATKICIFGLKAVPWSLDCRKREEMRGNLLFFPSDLDDLVTLWTRSETPSYPQRKGVSEI